MKVAILNTHAGSPGTLASTAFIGALADGLTLNGAETRVIGVTRHELAWHPEALRPFETSAPWIAPPPARFRDSVEAARSGILDAKPDGGRGDDSDADEWYLELLLQRDLERLAGDDRDLVVMVYPRSFALLSMAARIVRRQGWKLIVFSTEALTDAQIDPATRDAYIHCVVEQADGVWALSHHLSAFWESHGLPADRLVVNPPAVRESFFEASDPPRKTSAAYLGNLQHREVDYLLEIAELVRNAVPAFQLTVYGDTTEQRRQVLEAIISARNLEGAVAIEEPVLPPEVSAVLRNADVLLLPRARGEFSDAGFPNKLGEYLASGRPVVVTAVGDIPRYLTNGENAFLVEPDDTGAFVRALVKALGDRDLADRIGAGGRSVASATLASEAVARRLVTFIEKLPSRTPPTPGVSARLSRSARVIMELAALARAGMGRTAHRMKYTRTGHTRVVAAKMAAVRALQALRLRRPPAK